ncbi:hypothetical protein WQE_15266 [Paraburkholderia hospita]|uniref:Uncharacterized protein n=1 Tax=Paraburkholderia hospita TaxID=169430 RepID=A0ABN0FP25_9BURK|nr:hypothetical protein [Paraburkholderia hospita]EIN00402.1 hypothetical protein WQE_15266 [Paraburkholderia hospita]OUL88414.1 hypothetical protein CA602_11165 [Paraburkholderia hospita]
MEGWSRLRATNAYLQDASNPGLSVHTRLKCVWNAIYIVCWQAARRRGGPVFVDGPFDMHVLTEGLVALKVNMKEAMLIRRLADWSECIQPDVPNTLNLSQLLTLAKTLSQRFENCERFSHDG